MLGVLLGGYICLAIALFLIACLAISAWAAERSAADKRRLATQLHKTARAREVRARALEADAEERVTKAEAEAEQIVTCADALWRRAVEYAAMHEGWMHEQA